MTDIKAVETTMPEPFESVRIDVRPVGIFGRDGVVGHSVGVMDSDTGKGTRSSLEYAEAKANATLAAIRAYRRKNRAALEAARNAS